MTSMIVDLDVVTLAFWDKKDPSKLIAKIKSGMFTMVTPYILLEHLSRWKHRKLAEEISRFYEAYSTQIITAQNILGEIDETEYRRLLFEFVGLGVKEEDVALVIVASIFRADYLVTFNRKHLKSNEKKINTVLRKHGMETVKIVQPEEL